MKSKIGMAFGVFDGLHDGHKHFLKQARERCENLIVVVTKDSVSEMRKGIRPRQSAEDRLKALSSFDSTLTVVLGDDEDGQWHIIDAYDPERIFLGYDQGEVAEELKKMGIPFTFLDAYKQDYFKSSIISNPAHKD